MATPRERREAVVVPVSEESAAIRLYEEMLGKVGEMYSVSLSLESNQELAELLAQLAMVRVRIEGVVEKLRVEEVMRVQAEEYEKERKGDE